MTLTLRRGREVSVCPGKGWGQASSDPVYTSSTHRLPLHLGPSCLHPPRPQIAYSSAPGTNPCVHQVLAIIVPTAPSPPAPPTITAFWAQWSLAVSSVSQRMRDGRPGLFGPTWDPNHWVTSSQWLPLSELR